MLGDKKSGSLKASKETVEAYLRETYSDPTPRRGEDLGECTKLIYSGLPEVDFNQGEPKLQEVRDIIRKARSGSAPGPNGIPYKVYKQCPRLTTRLWRMFKVVWRRGVMVDSWFEADGCFIHKEENSQTLVQFRTISLLIVKVLMILNYYDHVKMRFTVNNFTTQWQRLEVGIVTGCTSSVIIFAAAMYLLVRSAEKKSLGPTIVTQIKQLPIRAFMDDLTITRKTVIEARWTLKELEELTKWARIKFKLVQASQAMANA